MTDHPLGVIGGVDCHTDTHTIAALDPLGRLLGAAEFPTTTSGYVALLDWRGAFGPIITVGVESTGSYGAGLTRHFTDHDVGVVEINQPHAHTRAR